MWPKEPLPLPCPGTWKGAPVVWEGAGRTPLASPFLPLPGPVWPEAEPASSRSSPRRPVSPPWRGGTSRPVPSHPALCHHPPFPAPRSGCSGPRSSGPQLGAHAGQEQSSVCYSCVATVPPARPCPPPPSPICCPAQALHPPLCLVPPLVAGPLSMRVLAPARAGGVNLGPLSSLLS